MMEFLIGALVIKIATITYHAWCIMECLRLKAIHVKWLIYAHFTRFFTWNDNRLEQKAKIPRKIIIRQPKGEVLISEAILSRYLSLTHGFNGRDTQSYSKTEECEQLQSVKDGPQVISCYSGQALDDFSCKMMTEDVDLIVLLDDDFYHCDGLPAKAIANAEIFMIPLKGRRLLNGLLSGHFDHQWCMESAMIYYFNSEQRKGK